MLYRETAYPNWHNLLDSCLAWIANILCSRHCYLDLNPACPLELARVFGLAFEIGCWSVMTMMFFIYTIHVPSRASRLASLVLRYSGSMKSRDVKMLSLVWCSALNISTSHQRMPVVGAHPCAPSGATHALASLARATLRSTFLHQVMMDSMCAPDSKGSLKSQPHLVVLFLGAHSCFT